MWRHSSLHSALVSFLVYTLAVARHNDYEDLPLPCAYAPWNNATCNEPIDPVTILRPNSAYFAKLRCLDCPSVGYTGKGPDWKHFITHSENSLAFNITLSEDRTQVFLNRIPIFPSLVASPSSTPPGIYAEQLPANFSRRDLDRALSECSQDRWNGGLWCSPNITSSVGLDYDYSATQTKEYDGIHLWSVTLDAIGGHGGYMDDPVWSFNNTQQEMLHIIIMGKEIMEDEDPNEQDRQAGSTLFGPFGEVVEVKYELDIVDVQFVERTYTFPAPPPSTSWNKFKHFFGFDPPYPGHHIIRLQDEWDWYARKNTLKQMWGDFWYWDQWTTFWIITSSIIAGLLALFGTYKLFLLILEQRRLAQWGGMDEVWKQIRDRDTEEERLLDGGYRDDPDDPLPPRYTDELPVNKPLPSKPLPEKPLPAVPLIDDI